MNITGQSMQVAPRDPAILLLLKVQGEKLHMLTEKLDALTGHLIHVMSEQQNPVDPKAGTPADVSSGIGRDIYQHNRIVDDLAGRIEYIIAHLEI